MFLIPTYLAPSATHGVGVFTARPLPAGTVIWEFTENVDIRLSEDELLATPERLQERLRTYSYRDTEDTYILCMDNAKFMNHSFRPNCDDGTDRGTVTLRAIEADEELTCDYRAFDLDSQRDGLESWKQ